MDSTPTLSTPLSTSNSEAEITTERVFATAIGIFLATLVRSMPQLGLVAMMVVVPMNMLSGNSTPLESQPEALLRFQMSL